MSATAAPTSPPAIRSGSTPRAIATVEQAPGEGRLATVSWHGSQMRPGTLYGDDSGGWRIPGRPAP